VQRATVYPWDFEWPGGLTGATRDVDAMAQAAGRFFKQVGGRSFYLHFGFSDPHRAGRGYGNDREYPRVQKRKYSPSDVIVPGFLPDRPEVRQDLADYYEAVDRLDQGVGFLFEELEKSGRAKDTLIIYLGDNGMPFPGAKASFYDSGHRLPLLIFSPTQRERGVANQAMVSFTDIMPTAIEWLGIPGPKRPAHGRSVLPILEQPAPAGWDEVYFSHTFHGITLYYPYRAVRTRTHKYVRFLEPELEMPLPSDLAADMGHLADAGHPEVQAAIADACARIRQVGKAAGMLTGDPEAAARYLSLGFTFVAVGSDVGVISQGAVKLATHFRQLLTSNPVA